MTLDLLILCGFSWGISIICLFRMWRRPDPIVRKLFWTAILAIPLFGPLLYGAVYQPPPVKPDDMLVPFDITRHSM